MPPPPRGCYRGARLPGTRFPGLHRLTGTRRVCSVADPAFPRFAAAWSEDFCAARPGCVSIPRGGSRPQPVAGSSSAFCGSLGRDKCAIPLDFLTAKWKNNNYRVVLHIGFWNSPRSELQMLWKKQESAASRQCCVCPFPSRNHPCVPGISLSFLKAKNTPYYSCRKFSQAARAGAATGRMLSSSHARNS